MFEVHLYIETDSKCIRPTKGCWGYVLEYKTPSDRIFTKCEVGCEVGSDKRLLLAAVEKASRRIAKESHVIVHTDTPFLLNTFNEWIHEWKKNSWLAAGGKEVKNRDLLQKIVENLHIKELTAQEDKSHSYRAWLLMEMTKAELVENQTKEIKAE